MTALNTSSAGIKEYRSLRISRNEKLVNTIIPYFSPTSKTCMAADALTSSWETERLWVDMSDPEYDPDSVVIPRDSLCVIALPCQYGRVPEFLAHRIAALDGENSDVVLLVTYGNDNVGDSLKELRDLAEEAGFFVRAAVSAVAQHALCPEVAAERPTRGDIGELIKFGQLIWELPRLPNAPLVLEGGDKPYMDIPSDTPIPYADARCIQCGRCVSACPVEAVSREQLPRIYKDKCITCMQCAAACPREARHLDALESERIKQQLRERGAFENWQRNTLYMRKLGMIRENV